LWDINYAFRSLTNMFRADFGFSFEGSGSGSVFFVVLHRFFSGFSKFLFSGPGRVRARFLEFGSGFNF